MSGDIDITEHYKLALRQHNHAADHRAKIVNGWWLIAGGLVAVLFKIETKELLWWIIPLVGIFATMFMWSLDIRTRDGLKDWRRIGADIEKKTMPEERWYFKKVSANLFSPKHGPLIDNAAFRIVSLLAVITICLLWKQDNLGSSGYSVGEFSGEFTIEGLVGALRDRGINLSEGSGIEYINDNILTDKSLYKKYSELIMAQEDRNLIASIDNLSKNELMRFNRRLIDRGDPQRSPKNHNLSLWKQDNLSLLLRFAERVVITLVTLVTVYFCWERWKISRKQIPQKTWERFYWGTFLLLGEMWILSDLWMVQPKNIWVVVIVRHFGLLIVAIFFDVIAMFIAAPALNEEIRQRAYYIWEDQDKPQGKDRENWIEAEKEIERSRFCFLFLLKYFKKWYSSIK